MSAWLLIIFVLFVSGANQVAKYLGAGGVALHAVLTAGVLLWGQHRIAQGRLPLSERIGALTAGVVLAAFVAAVLLLYPVAQAGLVGGGSDSDDAVNLAVRALFAGGNPYRIQTYLGNPATYLPGTFVLAAPFVAMGTAAYGNLAWLTVFAGVVWRRFGRFAIVGTTFLLLALTPRLWHALITGNGMVTSSIAVALAVLRLLESVERGRGLLMPALCLGFSITTRANFFLLLPVAWGFVAYRRGVRAAARVAGASTALILLLVVPFVVVDPPTFWRAVVVEQNWVGRSLTVLPAGAVTYPFICGVVALWLAVAGRGDAYRTVVACAATQAVPVLLAFVLESAESGTIHLDYTRYGIHLFFLALVAGWIWFEQTSLGPGGNSASQSGIRAPRPGV